jgi:hypothetical protein
MAVYFTLSLESLKEETTADKGAIDFLRPFHPQQITSGKTFTIHAQATRLLCKEGTKHSIQHFLLAQCVYH